MKHVTELFSFVIIVSSFFAPGCGCRDAACTTDDSQLQVPAPTGSGTTGGGSTTGGGATQEDDTFSCLSQNGPVIALNKDYGFTRHDGRSVGKPGMKFDARDGKWNTQQQPEHKTVYPVIFGGGGHQCWVGGTVLGTNPLDMLWSKAYTRPGGGSGNSASVVWENAPNATVDGVRIHNTWDALRMQNKTDDFLIKNVWVSWNHDDCVENDQYNTGTIEDSLFDNCFSGLSVRGGKKPRPGVMTLAGVLLNMGMMPARGYAGERDGHGPFFKYRKNTGIELSLVNSVFVARKYHKTSYEANIVSIPPTNSDNDALTSVRECRNNLMIWLGDGDFPGQLPSGCFTILNGAEGQAAWNKIKQNWINCHPNVPRISSDPQSNPDNCQPNAYGGGRGGTAIPN